MDLLFYHTHTENSNRSVRDFYGEDAVENHYADFSLLIEELSDEINPVIVRTEHAKKRAREENEGFHQRFKKEIEQKGGQVEYHKNHVTGTFGSSDFSIIEGVEGTLKEQNSHILLCGVPVEDEITFWNKGKKELYELSKDTAWTGLPHWNLMSPKLEDKKDILNTAQENDDIKLAVSYGQGYGLLNPYVNGKLPGQTSVKEYAEKYEASLVPELDWHTTLPYNLNGIGVLDDGTSEKLADGEIPVENILDADIVKYRTMKDRFYSLFKNTENFGTTMALPSVGIQLYDEDKYREIRRENTKTVADVDPEYLLQNTVPL